MHWSTDTLSCSPKLCPLLSEMSCYAERLRLPYLEVCPYSVHIYTQSHTFPFEFSRDIILNNLVFKFKPTVQNWEELTVNETNEHDNNYKIHHIFHQPFPEQYF